ncbi:MAG: hypothetical protein HRU26_09915 [Psychroserpens sp.]|nr:hypothetical protein [Psychroserpens sp.]
MRSSIKEVVQVDVLQDNPFAPKEYQYFDAMFLFLVLDAACKDQDSYKQTLRRLVSNYLRPGGMLILQSGTPSDGCYPSGDINHDVMVVNKEFLLEACAYAGLEISEFMERTMNSPMTGPDGNMQQLEVCLLSAYRKQK